MMHDPVQLEEMVRLSADIRIETIRALTAAGFGHIGGSMSIADVLGVLYGGAMKIRPQDPGWEERDRLVLSKGHCGPALYATLALRGYFPMELLGTINQPGTRLPSHCDMRKTPGIDMTTGSLGQGLSAAAGIALGNQLLGRDSVTYCILGDGECQEGQVWEAVQMAAHRELDHLVVFVDNNKKQLDAPVESICNPLDLRAKFAAFGWDARAVKGYDAGEILTAIEAAKGAARQPSAIILDTYKGIGCSFAEREAFNHYMVIDQQMCREAVEEIHRRLENGTYPGGDFAWAS